MKPGTHSLILICWYPKISALNEHSVMNKTEEKKRMGEGKLERCGNQPKLAITDQN